MVNYVCRTCLYVCHNEFSFRKLEKVKPVLELFVPEIKNCVGKYSLICEQCYYFLKNVEKFKVKCIETQNKLYTMNLDTIRDTHDEVLKSVVNDTHTQLNLYPITKNKRSNGQPKKKRALGREEKSDKGSLDGPVQSSAQVTKSTTTKVLCGVDMQYYPVGVAGTSSQVCPPSTTSGVISTHFKDQTKPKNSKDLAEYNSFQEFAVKQPDSDSFHVASVGAKDIIMNYDDEVVIESEEEDEYMTRSDLVAAGILTDLNEETLKEQRTSDSDEDLEIVEIGDSEDGLTTEKASRVEIKIVSSEKDSTAVQVKIEPPNEENPGFFNKQSANGLYKCRLCDKQYKTSKGLYNHTKEKHSEHLRFHHCEYCSFFTLWKSALTRHYTIFHGHLFKKQSTIFKCHQCPFESATKDHLARHILDKHAFDKFMRCTLCRARFSDSNSFAKHMEKEHLCLDMPTSSNYCPDCSVLFLTDEDYGNHVTEVHGGFSCVSCQLTLESKEELHKHQKSVHAISLRASVFS